MTSNTEHVGFDGRGSETVFAYSKISITSENLVVHSELDKVFCCVGLVAKQLNTSV